MPFRGLYVKKKQAFGALIETYFSHCKLETSSGGGKKQTEVFISCKNAKT